MKKMNAGFTLIELVVVIVLLGILAATALPRFIDLSGNARSAATQGIAGALSSGVNLARTQRDVSATPSTTQILFNNQGNTVWFSTSPSTWPLAGAGTPALTTSTTSGTATQCQNLMSTLLTNAPTNTYTASAGAAGSCIYTRTDNANSCIKYQAGSGSVSTACT